MKPKDILYSCYVFLKRIKLFFKKIFIFFRYQFRYYINGFLNVRFNSIVKEQEKNPKQIPIVIINFNQLKYLKQLIQFLQEREYEKIIVLDNKSTYKPLLDYYDLISSTVEVIKNNSNEGHRVFWKNKSIGERFGKGYYVVTDSDIVPENNCPENFLSYFLKVLKKNKDITKVGFSLKINDIPSSNFHREKIIKWETKFWKKTNKKGHFMADIDTTFALYRPLNQFEKNYFYKSLRLKPPYLAKHGGWYINHNKLTKEQEYYMKTATKSGSWRVDLLGNLIEKHYNE